jgi:hypothetical protein
MGSDVGRSLEAAQVGSPVGGPPSTVPCCLSLVVVSCWLSRFGGPIFRVIFVGSPVVGLLCGLLWLVLCVRSRVWRPLCGFTVGVRAVFPLRGVPCGVPLCGNHCVGTTIGRPLSGVQCSVSPVGAPEVPFGGSAVLDPWRVSAVGGPLCFVSCLGSPVAVSLLGVNFVEST